MKKYIVNSLVVFATIIFFGCNDDFMEKYPLDEISDITFWNTENDLKVFNNNFYHRATVGDNPGQILTFFMGHGHRFFSFTRGIWYLDAYTDNLAPRHKRLEQYQQIRAGKHNITTGPRFYDYNDWMWRLVREINVGLSNYDKANVSQSIKDKYAAEARLFRAWFYADLVSRFGDIQWIDKPLNIDSEELLSPRTPREEVMENILADLNFACEKLPEDWGEGDPGRLHRWAALHLKSRICLFEGTWRKYHGGSDSEMWLQESAEAAKELMDNSPYSLYSTGDPKHDYNAIHRMSDLTGNPEIIYWQKYELGVYSTNTPKYHKNYNGGATKSFVEDYLCTDGLPITLSPLYQGDEVYENIFENRDPRLRQTILHPEDQPYYNYDNHGFDVYPYPRLSGMVGGRTTATGYHVIKTYIVEQVTGPNNTATQPAILMRFGEVLLNYAEANAELGTITQNDLDISINKLRDRVGMPHLTVDPPIDPRYTNDGVSALIVEIRRERRIELFMEGWFRYDDLRRWKQGKKLETPDYGIRWDKAYKSRIDPEGKVILETSVVDGIEYIDVYKGTDWENPDFDESKHYLWPLPLNVISKNTNLEQTTGW